MITPKQLITVGYPRSGNTFLNYAFKHLYDFERVSINLHTPSSLQKYDKVFVPFRHPLDCISSWHDYSRSTSLEDDIRYYLRFYRAVLESPSVVLMDFDKFTDDLKYIQKKVFETFGETAEAQATVKQVKEAMIANRMQKNLPRKNKKILKPIKKQLKKMPEFQECLDLYDKLRK